MAPGQQSSRQLRDELREQRARLLARAALLKTDVGALLAPAVDAVPPAARPRLRDLNKRGHARLGAASLFALAPNFFSASCTIF